MPSSLDVTFAATIRRVLTIAGLLIFTRDPLTRARLSEVSYLILGFYGTYSVVLSMAMRLGRPFLLILSAHRQPQSQRRVHKPLLKHGEQEVKASKQLCRAAFACEADAQQGLLTSALGLKPRSYIIVTNLTIPSSRLRGCSRAIKAMCMWNAAFASAKAHAFWPRCSISKHPNGFWRCR